MCYYLVCIIGMDNKKTTLLYDSLYNDTDFCDVLISSIPFHKCVLATIEYFRKTFLWHDTTIINMSELCAVLFKKWLYCQPINKEELNVEICIEIYELSRELDIKFYIDINLKLFVYVLSASPDEQFEYFKTFNMYDSRFKLTKQHIDKLDRNSNAYAFCLDNGIQCDKDVKRAFEIYKQGWYERKDSFCLNNYAACINNGICCQKDEKLAYSLYKMNWDENKNTTSLHNYAVYLEKGIGCDVDKKLACSLYKMNWDENKNTTSLHNYARCLRHGIGCESDAKLAYSLHKMNWEENKNVDSLHSYAIYSEIGIGCKQDKKQAYNLYKLNWEENKHNDSLQYYIECLKQGIGCEKNVELATHLEQYLQK